MDKQQFNEKCLICLEENGEVDWNDLLCDDIQQTYKDCYYKYTQLACLDADNSYLSNMLCLNCSDGLEYINAFISKAIENHSTLLEKLIVKDEENSIQDPFGEECAEIQNFIVDEDSSEVSVKSLLSLTQPEIRKRVKKQDSLSEECSDLQKLISEEDSCEGSVKSLSSLMQPVQILGKRVKKQHEFAEECVDMQNLSVNEDSSEESLKSLFSSTHRQPTPRKRVKKQDTNSSDQLVDDKTLLEKKKLSKIPTCCSICSKVLSSKYQAIQHEKTHLQNRERTEVCLECGMKFYDKVALKAHTRIHLENREKSHKCEFCDKAFYHLSSLYVHRRIHVGKMIPCNLCNKEYIRQIDLDKHMVSHSATRINGDYIATKKIFVCCEICGENVRSINYKSHSAKHMNSPLAKCAICDKEFFSRKGCVSHLKRFHKKESGERSQFVITYKTKRFTNLFLQQNTSKIFSEE